MSLSEPNKSFEVELPAMYKELTPLQRRVLREQYVKLQGGFCAYCGSPLNSSVNEQIQELPIDWSLFPGEEAFLNYPVHLQHNHETGLTEGAVHAYCNAFMWNYFRR